VAALSVTVADDAGAPIEGAVVFVHDASIKSPPAPSEPYIMDQIDKQFVPRVLPVPVNALVRFPNKDDIHHHIYSFSDAKTFELPLYKGEPAAPVKFEKPGVVKLGCNIHDNMSGVILVLPNPHFVVTGPDGKAVLEASPGSELAVFHERLKGPVDGTRKKIGAEREVRWSLPLRPERRRKSSAFGYQ
jgi:plastocyanin